MFDELEKMQCEADAIDYIRKGLPVSDEAIESYYQDNTPAFYDLNQFIDAVHDASEG